MTRACRKSSTKAMFMFKVKLDFLGAYMLEIPFDFHLKSKI